MPRWCCACSQSANCHPTSCVKRSAVCGPKSVSSAKLHAFREVHAVLDRRQALLGAAGLLSLGHGWVLPQPAAGFSLPPKLDFTHLMQPEPVAFPRKALDQRFAVLLLRSTYEAVDALDFVAMGDLTDPLYFDFISFAQYVTVSAIVPNGLQVFKEYCEECPDQSKTIRRDAAYKDNSLLPAQIALRTGDLIYEGLKNGFREETFPGTPQPLTPDQSALVPEKVQKLLGVFVDRGFAIKAQVIADNAAAAKGSGGGAFTVRLEGPANLWGIGALQSRQALMIDAVDAMTVQAFLRASGFASEYSLQRSSTAIEQQWTFQPFAQHA